MPENIFSSKLLDWYNKHKRDLPWRDCGDPYKIWISEIMLQQTRVDQATPYYHRFIDRFPTIHDLAGAEQQEVLKIWEGLGYYSRARNMHHAAKKIVKEFNGNVPGSWDELTSLKGIGPYTASAILSIAFNKPYAVVDGNVIRTLARYFGIEKDIRRTKTRDQIQKLANGLIDPNQPGNFNQALMELGATICVPSNPGCKQCPVGAECIAWKTLKTDDIPYKSPAKKKPHYQIGVGIIKNEKDEVLIALRPDDAMLGGLWEFPGGKQKKDEEIKNTVVRELKEELGVEVEIIKPLMELDHTYSHFKITLHAYLCKLVNGHPQPQSSRKIKWAPIGELGDFPFPKANRQLTKKLIADWGD